MKKFLKTETFIYSILFGVCAFILLQSPLAPFAKRIVGIDSGIFIYSARQILDGQTMYKDIVEQKGPFLFFIDAAALLIFNRHFIGIWIFELFSLFAASIIMYKTARFFAGKVSSLSAVIAGLLFLVICLGRGNMTEEWALPYISIAMYIFTDYLKNNKPLTIPRLFILSLTFVLTFMLRANLTALWAGFGIVLLIKWVAEKRYKELIRNLSFILLFVLLSLLPFFLYFYLKDALSDTVYWVFTFNMFEYATGTNRLMSVLTTFLRISSIGITIPFLIAIYMFFRDKTFVHTGFLLALICTWLACSLGLGFWHYYAIFTPLLVIPYAYLFAIIKENISKRIYILLFILFIAFNSVFFGRQLWLISNNYSSKKTDEELKIEKLTEIITQNTKPDDKITVKSLSNTLYLYSGRTSATRFPYTLWSSFAREHYIKDIENALPKLIVQDSTLNSDEWLKMDSFLYNRYQRIEPGIKKYDIWKLKE